MLLELKDKRALVCGSSQGIGKSVAIELAMLGANITLFARNEEELKVVKSQLFALKSQKHHYLVADFSDPEQVREVAGNYIDKGNTVNILVNNSGGPAGGPIIEEEAEKFLATFNQHLINNQHLARLCLDGMIASGYGRIINIISTSVKIPLAGLGVSNTIRGAVASWAKTWANEAGKWGITVNNVLPGATATQRLDGIIAAKSSKTGKPVDQISDEMLLEIPMRRFARPEEIAYAVAFLASPAAGYINGINLPVDGGRLGVL